MDILILSLADEAFHDIAAISWPNKERYAEKHGYHYVCANRLLDYGRSASWNKIPWIQHYLPNYDWIFWTDADSLIMNGDIRLEDLIGEGKHDLIFAKDENGLNAGQFFIKNTDWSLDFLQIVWEQEQFLSDPWWEQAAIMYVLECSSEKDRVLYLPEKNMLNSYHNIWRSDYANGDFLVHFVGMGKEYDRLLEMMSLWSELAV